MADQQPDFDPSNPNRIEDKRIADRAETWSDGQADEPDTIEDLRDRNMDLLLRAFKVYLEKEREHEKAADVATDDEGRAN